MISDSSQVMCFGEPLIGFFTKKDSQGLPTFKMAIGGDTSNVALGVSKLGHPASYTTKLGNDFFAKKIRETWERDCIDTRYVFNDDVHQTGIYFAIFDLQGDHQFVYKRKNSATANYSVKDAEKVQLDGLKVFHLSGISQAISQSCLEASFYLMKKCRELKIFTSYDLNYRSPLWSKEYFKSVAYYTIGNLADLVSLNLSEAEVLGLSGDPKTIVKEILNLGPKIVALKLGKDGCIMGSSEGIKYGQSFEVKSSVETTGAGDSLTAAAIVGILEKMNLEQMTNFANAVASKVCASIGSTSGQPTREEIEKYLEENFN